MKQLMIVFIIIIVLMGIGALYTTISDKRYNESHHPVPTVQYTPEDNDEDDTSSDTSSDDDYTPPDYRPADHIDDDTSEDDYDRAERIYENDEDDPDDLLEDDEYEE